MSYLATQPLWTQAKLEYIEQMGLLMESFGLPRMCGRVLGALLMADPPEQSAEELATVLQASRGSISGATRLLESMGLIDRVSKPGERRDYFRNRPGAWHEATRLRAKAVTIFREAAEKGLGVVGSDDPEVLRGLVEMRDYFAFWETELPLVVERWERVRREEG